jgi:energy-coupling factor transporter ATP-binding protein EcfA2
MVMTLKKLPAECIAPLRLKEITLHGIGSFLRPARLEIRPLTILCGPNGCGKSTWIRALDLLARNADEETFPFSLAASQDAASLFSTVAAALPGDRWPAPDWDGYFGPLGTVGLVFECTKGFRLPAITLPATLTDCDRLLLPAEIKRGDTIRLRWTGQHSPRQADTEQSLAARMTVNGVGVELRICVTPVPDATNGTNRDHDDNFSILQVVDPTDEGVLGHSRELECNELCDGVAEVFRAVVCTWRTGFFHISAIRQIQKDEKVLGQGWTEREAEEARRDRWVGEQGERTHLIRAAYQFNGMLDPRKGEPYLCPRSVARSDHWPVRQVPDDTELWAMIQVPEIWQRLAASTDPAWHGLVNFIRATQGRLPQQHQNLVEFAIRVTSAEKTGDFVSLAELFAGCAASSHGHMFPRLHDLNALWPREKKTITTELTKELTELSPQDDSVANIRRKLLEKTLLEGEDVCAVSAEFEMRDVQPGTDRANFCTAFQSLKVPLAVIFNSADFVSIYTRECDRQSRSTAYLDLPRHIRWLHDIGPERLSPYESAFLRYWAMRHLDGGPAGILRSYCTDVQLVVWLKRLDCRLKMRMLIQDGEENDVPIPSDGMLAGFLGDYTPNTSDRCITAGPHWFSNGYLGNKFFSAGLLSAGIHQVLPVLVQYNVMKMNELCAVENPEVHLHPGMQLKFTEVFIENAKIGKFGLLETHSDLLIRRAMRAMREEDIRGSWVNICFVHGEDAPEYKSENGVIPQTAVAEPLRVDEQGRVTNWPEGFLDDDMQESAKLMHALYGARLGGETSTNE